MEFSLALLYEECNTTIRRTPKDSTEIDVLHGYGGYEWMGLEAF